MSISEERSPVARRVPAPPPAIRSGPLKPGMIVAERFELVRPIGSGGLAEVWVARDLRAGTEVALKLLHEHLCADESLTERFRRELAVTRDLAHPNIVRVFDLYEHAGKTGARPFFAMELLEGRTLADQLKLGPMPADEARRIAKAIASALEAAHRRGVVHRDLKPQNIILTKQGGLKLLDFGLARAAGWSRLTAQSTMMGTPGYIAPEILQGKQADARADLYSLGAVMFEMLTGKRAIASADVFAALRKKAEPPPSPRALLPEVSEADDALVRRALEPDPEQRFLDAAQMLRALEGIAVAPPRPIAIVLTAGDRDVVVHHSRTPPDKALKKVCAHFGLRMPGGGFRARLAIAGRNVLAAQVSRQSAELIADRCRAEGLAATVEPAKPIGKLRRWIEPHMEKLAVLFGLCASPWLYRHRPLAHAYGQSAHTLFPVSYIDFMAQLLCAALGTMVVESLLMHLELPPALARGPLPTRSRFLRWLEKWPSPAVFSGPAQIGVLIASIGVGGAAALLLLQVVHALNSVHSPMVEALEKIAAVFLFAGPLALLAIWRRPPVVGLQPPDTELRRLQKGIVDRVARLRVLAAGARPASQMVLGDALEMAEHARQAVLRLDNIPLRAEEEAAASGTDYLPASGALRSTDLSVAARDRDAAVDRFLRAASILDDLIAAKEGRAQSELLALLRMELGAPPTRARGQKAKAASAQADADAELPTLPPRSSLKE